jgi:hypothetical protein
MEGLNIKPDGIYVDGITGGGGHSLLIAQQLSDEGRLICFDRDLEALAAAKARLKDHLHKITFSPPTGIVERRYRPVRRHELQRDFVHGNDFSMEFLRRRQPIILHERIETQIFPCADAMVTSRQLGLESVGIDLTR